MKLLALYVAILLVTTVQADQPECATTSYANYPICYTWQFNSVNTSAYFNGALTNVQNASVVTISGKPYMQITATGIPQYDHQMTADEIAWLNARPKASTDFTSGATTAVAGQIVPFGESIGYSTARCSLGYWPPGPGCPSVQSKAGKFPIVPIKSTQTCYTGLGAMGYWINGVSVYNWWDGTSYNSQNIWHTMASYAEQYDMDICWGHAAGGDYHHHFYPNCLAEALGDDGSHKSPIYGYAADGYPILGPYVSAGVLAKSCWKARDYSANSPTGCGQANKRTCLLVNNLNITLGTTVASSAGPDTTATVVTQSGNELVAVSGFYYEDYYYDSSCTAQGDEYLDQYNGRYDSTYGYVYQVVIENNGGVYPSTPFPHYVGPVYYGQLDSNTVAKCQTNPFQNGGSEQPPPPVTGCCPDGSVPSSGNPPCKTGPPSPAYCNSAHHH